MEINNNKSNDNLQDFIIEDGVLKDYNGNSDKVIIPDCVTAIGKFAFNGSSSLKSIVIGCNVASIGKDAFGGCKNLTSITVLDGNQYYHVSGNCLIETKSKKLIRGCSNSVIPSDGSVTSIEEYAFSVSSFTSITIPDCIISIGDYAFSGCKNLTSITVLDGNPNYRSAGNCLIETKSKKLIFACNNSEIPDDGSVTSIEGLAFSDCSSITSITIPDSVTSIGVFAFSGCTSLKSIIIGNGVTSIEMGIFDGCDSLESITVLEDNEEYHSAGNCLIETQSKTIIFACNNSVIPNDGSVTFIGEYAFSGCTSLKEITIPECVTLIEDGAFSGCSSLESITIPNGVTAISNFTFCNCTALQEITLPKSVRRIEKSSFQGCTSLKEIILPKDVISIDNNAFSGCTSLVNISIPNSVTTIGAFTFSECSSLKEITIPSGVTSIKSSSFAKCTSLTNIIIPDGVTSIKKNAFKGCVALTEITIPSSVKEIGYGAFSNCNLKKVVIPRTAKVADNAFDENVIIRRS